MDKAIIATVLVFTGVFGFILYDGTRIGCDSPPLRDGAAVVIGSPCGPAAPEPEEVVIVRPIISLEAVKFAGWLVFPVALIGIGGAGLFLALRARHGI